MDRCLQIDVNARPRISSTRSNKIWRIISLSAIPLFRAVLNRCAWWNWAGKANGQLIENMELLFGTEDYLVVSNTVRKFHRPG